MSRFYTEEFKQDALRLLERTGRSYTQVSADLGVTIRERAARRARRTDDLRGVAAPASSKGSCRLQSNLCRLPSCRSLLYLKHGEVFGLKTMSP
jgi:transposase-like protein